MITPPLMRLPAGVALVVLVLAAACSVAGFAPGRQAEDAAGAPPIQMKAVTFNIRFGTADDGRNSWPHRREMVLRLLEQMDADVVGLQEALRFQLDEIHAALPGYTEIGVGRDDGATGGEYVPLLVRTARYGVAASGTFWLSDTPDAPGSKHWGNPITRICTWARLIDKASGRGVYVYNVHLDNFSERSRERSVELLARHMRSRPDACAREPVILMGDFNASESSNALRYLRGEIDRATDTKWEGYEPPPPPRLLDTFRSVHPEASEVGTYTGFEFGATRGTKIDHVLVSAGAEVVDAGIDRSSSADIQTEGGAGEGEGSPRYPSDHFPVWAVVTF